LFNSEPFSQDIGGYRLSGDIDYAFPTGTVFNARSYLVVAKDPAFIQQTYGISGVFGPFSNNLPNASGTVRLRNRQDAIMLEVKYSSQDPWPIAADGAGPSLVLTKPDYGEADPQAWSASCTKNGNPGTNNVAQTNSLTKVVINEFLAHTDPPLYDYIELFNTHTAAVAIAGCYLSKDPSTNRYQITNATINARGFLSLTETQLGFMLDAGGDTIYLTDPTDTYVIDAVRFTAQTNSVSSGRYPDGTPGFQALSSRTPGASNSPPVQWDVVINEIMCHPMSDNGGDKTWNCTTGAAMRLTSAIGASCTE